jgi:hypothetical protein
MIGCEVVVKTWSVQKDDTATDKALVIWNIGNKCMLEGYCARDRSVTDCHCRRTQKSVDELYA